MPLPAQPSAAPAGSFRVPPVPRNHASRPRLLAALDSGRDSCLTLLAAGPGAGKTVLLSAWARQQSTRTAWVTLTTTENEPRRFWDVLTGAARAAGVTPSHLPVLRRRDPFADL